MHAEPMSTLGSPTYPHQIHRTPTHLQFIHLQVKFHATLRHSTSLHAAWGISPLCFAKLFPHALTLFFLFYFLKERGVVFERRIRRKISSPCSDGRKTSWQWGQQRRSHRFFPLTCQPRGVGLDWGRYYCCCTSRWEGPCPSPWGDSNIWQTMTYTAKLTYMMKMHV